MTDKDLADDVWVRYQYLRDNGHTDYIAKAARCEDFFAGFQWDRADLTLLRAQRRPALTINKILSTIANVMGEQIYNRTETAFRPKREGATEDIAAVLTKVFMHISDMNQLPWVRSDVFADGIITSRGFYDVRLDFSDSLRGEVQVAQLNPKNVLPDADADEYDPDEWGDVVTTKWMSADQIALLYSESAAKELKGRTDVYFPYGFDSISQDRDRFGFPLNWTSAYGDEAQRGGTRNIRVIERQWKKLSRREHFVDMGTGDMRPVPENWDYNQISEYITQNPNITTSKKLVERIRWTVVADTLILHDNWSPYKHFTVVPFFPHFRRGRTIGLVENLLGPQELLNKVSSQELHVVNTTANSGWKVKRNALVNMSTAELEQRGSTTGLVLELDEIDNAEKIQPNQTPTGLDRISFKAEEHIKTISGVSDYQTGNPREDVSAKAIRANRQSGSVNLAKVIDNLNRTDYILARNILDCVQEYYSEERLMHITTDRLTNKTEQITINQATPEGRIVNDLTTGEYEVVVTSQPERDTFEDTQFDQVVAMRKDIGVAIPDKYVIKASRLKDKVALVEELEAAAQSPEAQRMKQLEMAEKEAEVGKLQAETNAKNADAEKKRADANIDPTVENDIEYQKMVAEIELEKEKLQMQHQLEMDKLNAEMALKQQQMTAELKIKADAAKQDALIKRTQLAQQSVAKNQTPTGAIQ